jgi:hypothetical protein
MLQKFDSEIDTFMNTGNWKKEQTRDQSPTFLQNRETIENLPTFPRKPVTILPVSNAPYIIL